MHEHEPSNHVFLNAKQYLNIARFSEDGGNLTEVPIALVSNYAFSIELMLKALDTTTLPSANIEGGLLSKAVIKTNIRGHDLKKIYNDLSPETKVKLSTKFKILTTLEIEPLLERFKNYFVLSRYYHEPSSRQKYDHGDLRILADGLEASLSSWMHN